MYTIGYNGRDVPGEWSFPVAVEKLKTLVLDKDLRNDDSVSITNHVKNEKNVFDRVQLSAIMARSLISQYRLLHGYTLKELSAASNINLSQISRLERGAIEFKNVTLENSIRLAQALDITADELYNRLLADAEQPKKKSLPTLTPCRNDDAGLLSAESFADAQKLNRIYSGQWKSKRTDENEK